MAHIFKINLFCLVFSMVLSSCLFAFSSPAFSQDDIGVNVPSVAEPAGYDDVEMEKPITAGDIRTLLFMPEDYDKLQRLLQRLRVAKKMQQEADLKDLGIGNEETEESEVDTGPRLVRLGGISYSSADKWIIWLNGQRVTPDSMPLQVVKLDVFDDYIEIQWLDLKGNIIYPIRLRPHQSFHIDKKIFLPG